MKLSAATITKSFLQGDIVVPVLRGITITFEYNKTYAITGPSGSGKSTLLHLLAGLDSPDGGAIYFNQQNIAQMSQREHQLFLNESLGLVFQSPYLIKELSVVENVMVKGLIHNQARDVAHEQAILLLRRVGLEHKADHHPFSLSGGEQQRVAIARAIFNKPVFLLTDEPTGNLDIDNRTRIVDLLLACQAEWHMGIIVSSHDDYVCRQMKSVVCLENGVLK